MPTRRTPVNRSPRRRITEEAIAAYRSGDRIALGRALRLRPWEYPGPLDVATDEPCSYPAGSAAGVWWPRLLELRRELEEVKAGNDVG
ncbi:MAG: hypothetical protein AB7E84_00255 [Xanthobacteraceae bacterium]